MNHPDVFNRHVTPGPFRIHDDKMDILDERKEIDSLPKQIHDHQPVSAPSSKSNRIREEPLEPNQNTERKPDRDEREHREDTRTKITEQQKVQSQPNQRSVSPILRDHKAEKLDKHRKLIQE